MDGSTKGLALARPLDWRFLGLGLLWAVNLIGLAVTFAAFVLADAGADWAIYAEAGRRVWDGTLYDWAGQYEFRYNPLTAYAFALIPGYTVWTALHFLALLTLPRKLSLLALVTWPFWSDIYNGNTSTFAFVAAWHALNGSRLGIGAFGVLALLIPRPFMLPVLAWLGWKRPESRPIFLGLGVVIGLATLATGYLPEWIASFGGRSDLGAGMDFGPGQLIGVAWVPIGLGLAVWLTVKGRLGLASLAASPYWLPYYGMMLLLEARRPR